jgi:hypothetical protein
MDELMVSKKRNTKTSAKKGQVKTLKLKRETIKDLSAREKKNIKGGSGISGSVLQSRIV